jgi:hypothetical protein
VRTPHRWIKYFLRERVILAGPVWAACENSYAHVGFKNHLKMQKLTNEIKILNHEKIKNEELTVMLQTDRQMISCSSRKSTSKLEGKMGVFGNQ